MTNETGHARNTSPEDEMDARELVPEMMERLWAGEAIELATYKNKPNERWRRHDYVNYVADRPEVVSAMELLTADGQSHEEIYTAALNARIAIREAIRSACEADADYYAAAKREISDGDHD